MEEIKEQTELQSEEPENTNDDMEKSDDELTDEETDQNEDKYNEDDKKYMKRKGIFKYCPYFSFVVFCITALAIIVHVLSFISTPFADFFNENISSVFRMIFAKATGWFPFSLGETLIVALPALIVIALVYFFKIINYRVKNTRYLWFLFSILCLMYSLFVLNYGIGYQNSPLSEKLGIEQKDVTPKELFDTASIIEEKTKELLDDIDFSNLGNTKMPYSLNELTDKINAAYDKAYSKYTFISKFHSRVKYIALSKPMTYTHISGVYSYYTGEANININYPDFVIPYTIAHEMAHQRGIAPEDEANMVAFLVCLESDDAYIRYSAYSNILEYFRNALYTADSELFNEINGKLDYRQKREINSYNDFFKEYSESTASKVSSAINDTYLKIQGEKAGEQSYGLVVDLVCAYYKNGK